MPGAAHIVINGPGHEGTRQPLREGITSFGRLPSNDVVMLGDLVSRHHVRILFFDGRASIQDLGSHNGSWVNGERVTTRPLEDGDIIRIGNFRLSFHQGTADDALAVQDQERTSPTPAQIPPPTDNLNQSTAAAAPALFEEEVMELPPNVQTRTASASAQTLIAELDRVVANEDAPAVEPPTLLLLYRVTDALARATDVRGFLEEVLALTIERINVGAGAFYRLTGSQAQLASAQGPDVVPGFPPPVSRSVLRWAIAKNFTVYSEDVAADLRFQNGGSVMALSEDLRALVCAPVASRGRVLGALYVSRSAAVPFADHEVAALEAIAHLTAVGIERIELRRRSMQDSLTRESLARFYPPGVIDRLMADSGEALERGALAGHTATVCLCDIPGFSSVAERLSAKEIGDFLGTFVEKMSAIVFAHNGSVSPLVSGGLVAVFGAPYSHGKDAISAISAAIEMRRAFDELIAARPQIGPRRLRFGIETGWALCGTIGPPARAELAVLGEAMQHAALLQAAAAPGGIVVGAGTLPLVKDAFRTEDMGLQQIRGRREPLAVFEVTGTAGPPNGGHTW